MARLNKRSAVAVLWHTLVYHAKKCAVRADLVDGSHTPVRLTLSGSIGGQRLSESISGRLIVGTATEVASSQAPANADVVAYLLSRFDDRRRTSEVDKLVKGFADKGSLPDVSEQISEQAVSLLRQLRTQITVTRDGTIRFEPDSAANDAAKAA